MNILITDVRCVSQGALLGAVTSNLRALAVTVLPNDLTLNFFYENEPTDEEVELSQVASTEVLSGFRIFISVREQQILLPQPEPIPLKNEDLLVYYRYEGNSIAKIKTLFNDVTIASVRMASQYALLGAITSNLRAVSIVFIDKDLTLNFYYDKKQGNEEIDLSEIVMKDFISCFESATGKVQRFIIPEPERIALQENGIWAYWRYEEYLIDD